LSALWLLAASRLFTPTSASAQDAPAQAPAGDELFPGSLRGVMSVATGVPFVAMAELGLGLGDAFAVGLLAGVTPRVAALGGRPRVRLLNRERMRMSVAVPVLYYPRTHSPGGAPWMLTRPSLLFEPRLSERWRLSSGLGAVAATTIARIARARGQADYSDGGAGMRGYKQGAPVTAGLWWTVSAGAATLLSERWTLFAETALILDGAQLAGADWVGGPPVVATLGLSRLL
jgi:hypothetical protein